MPNPKDTFDVFYCCGSASSCCISCHEDNEEFGFCLCETEFSVLNKTITALHCCSAEPSQEDVEKRFKELNHD